MLVITVLVDSRVLDLDATTHVGVVAASIARIDIVAVHEEGAKTTLTACSGLIACIGEQLATFGFLPVVTHILGVDHLLGRTAAEGLTAWTSAIGLVDIQVGILVGIGAGG